jgi:hypothetical protein
MLSRGSEAGGDRDAEDDGDVEHRYMTETQLISLNSADFVFYANSLLKRLSTSGEMKRRSFNL